ncbi:MULTISPECIES: type IV secretion system protein [unclassified Paraburkholderia]|uniref:type IV secretion system protein n=1 Tax=unclassified Paraburkholderia TaxID=2615204 RepID=UPI002AB223EF|nr:MULTISPECIES: type IV secretion system protein [unclassified Paraburkholderia]
MYKAKRYWRTLVLGILLQLPLSLLFPAQVWASDACAAVSAGEKAKFSAVSKFVDVIIAPINSAQSTIATKANSMASSASSVALVVAGLLAVTYLLWSIVDSYAGSGESIMSIMVGVLVPAAITSAAIGSYATLVSTSGGIQGVITAFTQAATGSTSVSSSMASLMQTLAETLGTAFTTLFSEAGCTGIWSFTSAMIGELLLSVLILICATVLAAIAIGDLVGVLLTGVIMVGIAVAVGPLFVACAVCKWSRGWFDSWLKFLLGASAYQMVVSIILTLVKGMVTSIQTEITTANPANSSSSAGVSIAGLLGLLGMTWVLRHLFMQVPTIARGLFGGGGVGVASFNKAVAQGAKDAVKGAERTAKAVKATPAVARNVAAKAQRAAGAAKDFFGGGKGGDNGGQGSSGPTVSTETGSFSGVPQLTGPTAVPEVPPYGGPPQLAGPSSGEGTGGDSASNIGASEFVVEESQDKPLTGNPNGESIWDRQGGSPDDVEDADWRKS